jgi:hypothetical protein
MTATELSPPGTKSGQLQRAALHVYREHAADGALPTTIQFIWYELEQRGVVDKNLRRGKPGVNGRGQDQDLADAVTRLRELGLIPWADISDENRQVLLFHGHPTLRGGLLEALRTGKLDPWDGRPPLILCETRAVAGALEPVVYTYRAGVTGIGGQVRGHLMTSVVLDLVAGQLVGYLGDLDHAGNQIEDHARRVIEAHGPGVEWVRLGLNQAHADRLVAEGIEPIAKRDRRYRDGRPHLATELEAYGQRRVVGLVRDWLDERLPVPLEEITGREQAERDMLRSLLMSGEAQ